MTKLQALLMFALSVFISVSGSQLKYPKRDVIYYNNTKLQSGRKLVFNAMSKKLSKPNNLLTVYNDKKCQPCVPCMERAIKARMAELKDEPHPEAVNLHNSGITGIVNNKRVRVKREADDFKDAVLKDKKIKTKKPKSISVTKYVLEGNVHALKVKETSLNDGVTTCDVYSVLKSYPCQSAEGISLLESVKKIKNKRNKKQTTSTPLQPISTAAALRKRDTSYSSPDNTQMPENVMLSFEEYF